MILNNKNIAINRMKADTIIIRFVFFSFSRVFDTPINLN